MKNHVTKKPGDLEGVEQPLIGGERCDRLRRPLLQWFRENGRDLPWRRTYCPYHVWISEMMLQQTQVKTMLPYYRRWMERFPDVSSLAGASEEEILRHWEGLGYYARARNIHKAARIIVDAHGGELPRDHKALIRLPGIGKYSAGAVMSIAFNDDFPVVDGNVERIFSRVFDISDPPKESRARRAILRIAKELLPPGDARGFNQALMDLGATVCLPRKPLCPLCPVRPLCLAFQSGVVDQRPVRGRKKVVVPLEVAVGVLEHDERILIQKRPPEGLMANLWEFPGGKVAHGETHEEALVREFREELDLRVRCLGKITLIRHSYTSFRVALHAFWCRLERPDQDLELRGAVEARWVRPGDLDRYAFPAANRKLIRILLSATAGSP